MKSGVSFRDSHMLASKNMTSGMAGNNIASGMNQIDEKLEDSSEQSETRTAGQRMEQTDSESEEEGFGRSQEHIDLATVEVKSNASPTKTSKPILSAKEV